MLDSAGLAECPKAKVAAFVANAWDPRPGCETPWLDLAERLAGSAGIKALGPSAQKSAPGTDSLARLFEAAGGRVLILCDEVLNFCNRHRDLAEGFYAFLQNLTVAMTGTTHSAAVISLPRSQVEMTDWDLQWQDRITKIVRRVAKDLIANDEAEISEVVRRRLPVPGVGTKDILGSAGNRLKREWRDSRLAYRLIDEMADAIQAL
jgi:Protein of unknown function (DUF499)